MHILTTAALPPISAAVPVNGGEVFKEGLSLQTKKKRRESNAESVMRMRTSMADAGGSGRRVSGVGANGLVVNGGGTNSWGANGLGGRGGKEARISVEEVEGDEGECAVEEGDWCGK